MGGRIWVESVVGQGSTFSFIAQFKIQSSPTKHFVIPSVDMKGQKILVVDDNATNRVIQREMLGAWGALVVEAEDGHQALVEIERANREDDPYKLVLLDHHMPVMDGFQVAELIRNDSSNADTVMIMFTSEGRRPEVEQRCRELVLATVGNQQKWDTFVKERSGGNGSVVGLPEQVVVAFAAG